MDSGDSEVPSASVLLNLLDCRVGLAGFFKMGHLEGLTEVGKVEKLVNWVALRDGILECTKWSLGGKKHFSM